MQTVVYTLFELNEHIRRFVALNLPAALWVKAEIAEADERRGHHYLTLIEKGGATEEIVAQSKAVFWARSSKYWEAENKMRTHELLQAGRDVKLLLQAEFHERYGFKFIITDIDPDYTLGQMARERQKTLDYLSKNGLLELNAQLTLPMVPQRLAIITSPAAAGLQDFLQQLKDNTYGYNLRANLYTAAVQGPQTSPEIRQQLRAIAREQEHYDAIVIIRGGGSKIDLSDFDDQALCEAVAQSPLPVICGIGHETDQSVMDMVVHTSLKTPTAVADFMIQRLLFFEQQLAEIQQRFQQLLSVQLRAQELHVEHLANKIEFQTERLLQQENWRLKQQQQALPRLVKQQLRMAAAHLKLLTAQQQSLSLDHSLRRGFGLITAQGKIIREASQLQHHERISVHLQDGVQALSIKAADNE